MFFHDYHLYAAPAYVREQAPTVTLAHFVHVPWPQPDPAALVRDTVTLAVQVNGKLRATIEVPANISKEEAEAMARAQPQVQAHLEGLAVRKVIVVPGKIVNIVAG